jgi:hypothetical protein
MPIIDYVRRLSVDEALGLNELTTLSTRSEHQYHDREMRTGSAQIAAGGGANEPQRSIRGALSRLVINAGIGEALTRDPC